jgi:hypothetical protein
VEGSCEHRNEPLGSIKMQGSSRVAAQLETFQEGLSSLKLVNFYTVSSCNPRKVGVIS